MSAKAKAKAKVARVAVPLPPGCEALLGKEQICFAIGVSQRTFDSMVSAGSFPRPDTKVGPMPRWRVETLNAWVSRKCQKPGDPPPE
jgi:predicted DNA-binding transcriptional regulator AlpA